MKQLPRALAHLPEALEDLRQRDRLRVRGEPDSGLSFCSNDYLGLAHHPAPPVALGGGAARLIAGEHVEHGKLERALAEWLGVEQALLFSSGYAANVGVLSALVGPSDLVVSDALNHASIIDGAKLSRARVVVTPHLDALAVERALRDALASTDKPARTWVVTETYFSMDADTPDLAALRRVCDEHTAGLIVDEAHALGVLGPEGRGMCAAAGIEPDARVGTLGKALGASGAFVVGSRALIDWLWNRARSHVFSTAVSPAVVAGARSNLERALRDPTLRERAVKSADRFRDALRRAGEDVRGHGPIVPWIIGSESDALHVASVLRQRDVHAIAIRPPTVPEGTSRLRLTFTARHIDEDVTRAIEVACAAR